VLSLVNESPIPNKHEKDTHSLGVVNLTILAAFLIHSKIQLLDFKFFHPWVISAAFLGASIPYQLLSLSLKSC